MNLHRICCCLIFSLVPFSAPLADEGMWQPHQIETLGPQLSDTGLEIEPSQLTDPSSYPLNAVVSLGGYSASFVSPKGLVVTNHHCVYRSVQVNSTPERNLLEEGFLAAELAQELPAAPGTRVYVTEAVTDVTGRILSGVTDTMGGLERYKTIETNRKAVIKRCEQTGMHRCQVTSFHHGLSYYLIKRLEIRDVRLVHVPPASIGKYGGDIDNWQWPRHTGDFGFYRAYVGADGKPADYHESNVPYSSPNFLKLAAQGVREGDFVMAAGYPGSTNRYRTASEIAHQFTWFYPRARQYREELIATIEAASAPESQARLNYASTVASLANYAKNYQSMEESFAHSDLLARRQQQEQAFQQWVAGDAERADTREAIAQFDKLVREGQAHAARDLWLGYFDYAQLPDTAMALYRLAVEKQKPDAEREPGYQERDMDRFRQSLQRMTNTYDPTVDQSVLAYLLQRYRQLDDAQRLASIDAFFDLGKTVSRAHVSQALVSREKRQRQLAKLYRQSELSEESVRLAWMEKSVEDFRNSKDPMIRFAVETFDERMAIETAAKERAGRRQHWRPRYMAGWIAWRQSLNQPVYADANSTLRITYGQVLGNQPRDGLRNTPFTRLEGILEKDSGVAPFNAPAEQLALIRQQEYGGLALPAIDSVPVNFLSTLDITGGNSGTAVLNGRGELVGLLFDGVYESIIGDWDFNDEKNRAISVDARYMLWVMTYLGEADNLLVEMSLGVKESAGEGQSGE